MPVAITVRNVPDEVRNILAARAAARGHSLQEYLRSELIAAATRLTVDELIERSRQQSATSAVDVREILDAVHADRR